ncbi:MAG TPA: alpha/beta hydrolase [Puia sp.]|nr:alpha/beta hydrolase [Puia sp.]
MRKKWLLLIPIALIAFYFAGPSPATPSYKIDFPQVPTDPAALEAYIRNNEAPHKLKPDNEARIIWADSKGASAGDHHAGDSLNAVGPVRQRTEYAMVYLHGFSASQGEGAPLHRNLAKKFGCNLYLSRLAEHGIDTTEPMLYLSADGLWESAKQALAIGGQIGNKVVLVGTSTGGTLALQLAAAYPDKVAALVLLSPNIEINDPNAWVLNNHWGLQVAHKVAGSDYIITKEDYGPVYRQYWYPKYRLEGAVALEELLETTMNKETFGKVAQPVGVFYYYKDPIHQDSTVKVSAILRMFDQLGTQPGLKYKQAFPEAGTHVICSPIRSHDAEGVENAIVKFLADIVHLTPADSTKK